MFDYLAGVGPTPIEPNFMPEQAAPTQFDFGPIKSEPGYQPMPEPVQQTTAPDLTSDLEKFAASPASTSAKMAPEFFDWKRSNVNRYKDSPYFNFLGFDPNKDEESLYGARQTWGNTLSNALTGAWKLGSTGFVDGWKGWGRMANALYSWDWSKLDGDPASLKRLNDMQNNIMNRYAIYDTPESSNTFWNRKTFGNFLQQSGFSLGTLAQTVSEQLLTKAIEAAIFVPTGGVGSAELDVAEELNTARKMKNIFNQVKVARDLNEIDSIWKDDNAVGKFFTSVVHKLPGADIIRDMKAAKDFGADAKTIGLVGLGGVKRGLSELNLALTEARMESAGTYGGMYNQMYYDYLDKHGEAPVGQELDSIQHSAYQAGKDNFVFNSLLLSAMNRIQFDNLFKSFRSGSKIGQLFGLAEEEGAHNLLNVTGKVGDQELTQVYKKGALGTIGVLPSIAKDFGKKQALIELGRPLLHHIGKWEVTEGVQELLQNASNDYFTNYYTDLYNSKYDPSVHADKEKSLDYAVKNELNMQGLKTFMSGALTGLLTSGPSKVVEHGFNMLGTTSEQRKSFKQEQTDHLNELNGFLRNPASYLSEINKNFKIQADGSKALDQALKGKDQFAFENIRQSMLGQMVAKSIRMNTHEALLDTLKAYGEHMSKEQFEQAFEGFGYTDDNKTTAQEYVKNITDKVQSYVDTWQHLQEEVGNKINPDIYPPNSRAYKEASFAKARMDDMIEVLAGNKEKAKDSLDRMQSIFNKLAATPAIGASLASSFTVLGSEDNVKNEMYMLREDLKGLNTIPKKSRSEQLLVIQKTKQLEALSDWQDHSKYLYKVAEDGDKFNVINRKGDVLKSFDDEQKAEDHFEFLMHDSEQRRKDAFTTYLNAKNEENHISNYVTDDDIKRHFKTLNDYTKLNKKAQQFTDAYNMIINPKNFSKLYQRMLQGSKIATFHMQMDSINTAMGKWGFAANNTDLTDQLNKLQNIQDQWTEDDKNHYYDLMDELGKRAANYTDKQAKEYKAKLDDVIDNNKEFKEKNVDLYNKIAEISAALKDVQPGSDIYNQLLTQFKDASALLYRNAETFLKNDGTTTTDNGRTDGTTTTDTDGTEQSDQGTESENTDIDEATKKQKALEAEKKAIIENNLKEIKSADDPDILNKMEEMLSEQIAIDPVYKTIDHNIFKNAIAKRREELTKIVNFASVKQFSVIEYNHNGKPGVYQVISKKPNELKMASYPRTANTADFIISKDDFNKNAMTIWNSENDYRSTHPEKTEITPHDNKTAAQSQKTNEDFFGDRDAIARATSEADRKSMATVEDDFLSSIGCQ